MIESTGDGRIAASPVEVGVVTADVVGQAQLHLLLLVAVQAKLSPLSERRVSQLHRAE